MQAACRVTQSCRRLEISGASWERHYGRPRTLNGPWIGHGGGILLLQSRPETVWSRREPAPVARAAENPLSHVMSIFGGRR